MANILNAKHQPEEGEEGYVIHLIREHDILSLNTAIEAAIKDNAIVSDEAESALEKLAANINELLGVKNLQANLSAAVRLYQLEPVRPDDTLQNHTGLKTIDAHDSNTVVIDSLMQTVPRTKNR